MQCDGMLPARNMDGSRRFDELIEHIVSALISCKRPWLQPTECTTVRRATIAIIILMGLLLQAAAVVRHASMLVSASISAATPSVSRTDAGSAELALIADLSASICHPDGMAALSPMAPEGPAKTDMSGCPICNGLASAFALVPSLYFSKQAVLSDRPIVFVRFDQRVARHAFLRPQGRGPPVLG